MEPNVPLIARTTHFRAACFNKPRNTLADRVRHEVADMKLLERIRICVLHHHLLAFQCVIAPPFFSFGNGVLEFFIKNSWCDLEINEPRPSNFEARDIRIVLGKNRLLNQFGKLSRISPIMQYTIYYSSPM